ncbi:MAG: aspartate ammonia-lyase, partial [Planctomycetes bacterium]|nr:aspartate ammonia-lyase [Planctomycetota bacterium]
AVPIRMGQVFAGFVGQIDAALARLETCGEALLPLAMGGTAVGTGLNAHPDFAAAVIARIASETGMDFVETDNHFAAQSSMDRLTALAGELKTTALSLGKIANDIRFLASGPRSGLGELKLPSLQPGSSIMPGKVNPVVCEALMQACAFAVSADAGVSYAAAVLSNFELAVAWPYATWHTLEAIRTLANAVDVFTQKAIHGLEADFERCRFLCEQSLALATSLAPVLGYELAAAVAKKASQPGGTVRAAAIELSGLPTEKLDTLLDPGAMTGDNPTPF